ncbi:MAG: hypothetical protein WBA28_04880 [Microbacteriaceae bacterium]
MDYPSFLDGDLSTVPANIFKPARDLRDAVKSRHEPVFDTYAELVAAKPSGDFLGQDAWAENQKYVWDGSTWSLASIPGDTGWQEAALNSGWTVNTQEPAYRKRNGIVYLRGRANRASGANAYAFHLPSGFRPGNVGMVFGLDANGTFVRCQIDAASGGVGSIGTSALTALSFDGTPRFIAES